MSVRSMVRNFFLAQQDVKGHCGHPLHSELRPPVTGCVCAPEFLWPNRISRLATRPWNYRYMHLCLVLKLCRVYVK